jgi:hypothetical protein
MLLHGSAAVSIVHVRYGAGCVEPERIFAWVGSPFTSTARTIQFRDRPDDSPLGVGKPAAAPCSTPPAYVFARVFTPARVKAALQAAAT